MSIPTSSDWNPVLVLRVAFVVCCLLVSAILVARAVPVTTTRRVVHVTEYKQKKPISPDEACTTARVLILETDPQKNKDGTSITWFVVQPVGDSYRTTCHKDGNYSNIRPGQVFVLQGEKD